MYLSFYHLKHKPFQISTDPRFLWLGDKHEEALATLRYGVLDNKGFLLLTGDVGTGKTTLINALLKTLGENTLVATIRDPDLEPLDFYNYTAHAFGIEGNFSSKGAFLIEFERFLHDAGTTNKTVLLIIDEAQRINQKLLEDVRILSNIEREDRKLLNIFFVGQIEFNEILLRPENRPIRQRITVNYNIPPLTMEETGAYIEYRLKVAGTKKKLFDNDALKKIFSFSQGYPRLINIICDRSLLTGFVEETRTITAKQVRDCINELTIPRSKHSAAPSLPPPPVNMHQADPETASSLQVPLPILEKGARRTGRTLAWQVFLAILVGVLSAAVYLGFQQQTHLPLPAKTIPEQAKKLLGLVTDRPDRGDSDSGKSRMNPQSQTQPDYAHSNPPLETTASNGSSVNNPAEAAEMKGQGEIQPTAALKAPTGTEKTASTIQPHEDIPAKDRTPLTAASLVVVEKTETRSPIDLEKLTIPFPTNSNFPPLEVLNELNELAAMLDQHPEFQVFVKGYTDAQGNEAYNRKLSEFRANSIKSYLVGRGLPASRISIQGLGALNPIAPNDTPDGRMANRRVEVELTRSD